MPLYKSPAVDAIQLRKANENSFWGTRESRNRVEPIATPHFALDLKLEPGDKIFTVGSCFARNVEGKLAQAGFRLPMRELLDEPSFAGVQSGALNNFSPPSLWNELGWAVGEAAFNPDLAIVEYASDLWLDLHVTKNVRPAPRDTVVRRRSAISSAYRSFVDCKLIIITLGLVECWYDCEAGRYLNTIPPPPLVRRYPSRFELHVLNHEETFDYCDRAIRLLREHGRGDATILLSVSPVALGITHRPEDVLTANCYSKSVLRAVAEELVARHDNVHYFPSYESVTLSDRRIAWANDLTHVTDELIAYNVDRLVQRLLPSADESGNFERIGQDIEAGGSSSAYRHAIEVRKRDASVAGRFFDAFGEWSARSPTFATEHVEWLVEQRKAEQALQVASVAGADSDRMALAVARALIQLKRIGEALEILHGPRFRNSRLNRYWAMRVEAEGKAGDLQAIEASLGGWCSALPKKTSQARIHVARSLLLQSAVARALELLDLALVDEPTSALAHMLAAEAHLIRGDSSAARRSFERVEPTSASEGRRYSKLKDRIGEAVGA